MSDPTVDPVISLKDLLRDQWTTTPGTTSVTFQIVHPPTDKGGTFVAVTRPLPAQYFTSGQRRTQFVRSDIGAQPSGMYYEGIEVECVINKSPDNKQTILAAKWNMMREVKRIVKTYGATLVPNVKYLSGDWQHDDFGSDPMMVVSRGVITAQYWK